MLQDARRAEAIHRKEVAKLRSSFVRSKTKSTRPKRMKVPREIVEKHKRVRLFIDIMFVNRILFLYTISKELKFRMSTHMSTLTKESLLQSIQEVVALCKQKNFIIEYIDADLQFECV